MSSRICCHLSGGGYHGALSMTDGQELFLLVSKAMEIESIKTLDWDIWRRVLVDCAELFRPPPALGTCPRVLLNLNTARISHSHLFDAHIFPLSSLLILRWTFSFGQSVFFSQLLM